MDSPPEQVPGVAAPGTSAADADGTSVLRNRQFLLLWMAQAISQTAQNAIWFGLMVVVEEATRSTTHLGFAVLSTILPAIFLGIIAGVFVDRLNKKTVLVTTNMLRGFAVLGYLLYNHAIYFVYLINLVSCAIGQFFGPAEASTIPQLVRRKQLITANSLFNLTFTGSQLAGLVLIGPPIIKLFGPPTLFIVASLAYLMAAGFVWFLPKGEPPHRPLSQLRRETIVSALWGEMREGWQFIQRDRKTGLAIVHLTLISSLVLVMSMLAPRYVVAALGIRADDSVYIFAPAGVGILLGTVLAGRLAARFGKAALVHTGLGVMGASMLLVALLRITGGVFGASRLVTSTEASGPGGTVPWMLAFAIVIGFSFAMVTIPAQTVVMERAPVASRGRIFSVQIMLGNVASVLPLLFLGGVADVFGVDATLGVVGLVILVVAAYSINRSRKDTRGDVDEAADHLPHSPRAHAENEIGASPSQRG